MAKGKGQSPAPQPPPAPPQIYEATLRPDDSVAKGKLITQAQAESRRRNGLDVVVCGPDHQANKRLALVIEANANGKAKRCPPHLGPRSLPHYQPDPRPPEGHT